MSGCDTPPVPAPLHPTPVCCPACAEDLRAAPHPAAPSLIQPCGHSVCGECAAAVAVVAAPLCPICAADIVSTAPNTALGALGEAAVADAPAPTVAPCWDCARESEHDGEVCVLPSTHCCTVCDRALC